MKQAYFIFKNISSEDYLMVNKLPSIIKATRDIQKIEVDGRDGFLTIDKGTHRGTVKTVECTIFNLNDIDFISSWLDGSADVIFSNEPDRVYKATIINQIDFKKIALVFHTLLIQFECQPHKYSLSNNVIILTSQGTVFNSGSVISKPIIKIFGTGSIDLNINGNIINLTNVSEYVVIDSELLDAYKETSLKNNDMNGEFPELIIGSNSISWTGIVTKVEITPNWRYL
jgi:predicted phage tail component-like protein